MDCTTVSGTQKVAFFLCSNTVHNKGGFQQQMRKIAGEEQEKVVVMFNDDQSYIF